MFVTPLMDVCSEDEALFVYLIAWKLFHFAKVFCSGTEISELRELGITQRSVCSNGDSDPDTAPRTKSVEISSETYFRRLVSKQQEEEILSSYDWKHKQIAMITGSSFWHVRLTSSSARARSGAWPVRSGANRFSSRVDRFLRATKIFHATASDAVYISGCARVTRFFTLLHTPAFWVKCILLC